MATDNQQIVEEIVESSPTLGDEVDPIRLLNDLDGFIERLDNEPTEQTIFMVQQELSRLEVLTAECNDKRRWIAGPMNLNQTTRKRSTGSRILHLLKTGGEWQGEHTRLDTLEFRRQVVAPLSVTITSDTMSNIMDDKVSTMVVALDYLHRIITEMLEGGADHIGIYQKPNGVVAMNRLLSWVRTLKSGASNELALTLDVMPLDKLITNATFSVQTQN